MMVILSENSKKEYTKSVTELVRLQEKKDLSRRPLLHKQTKVVNLLKKENKINVQNINSILLELRDILKNRRATALTE
jgi:hypothetical protein